jgi:hypothetical protein
MNNQLPEGELYDLTMIREISQGNNDFVKKGTLISKEYFIEAQSKSFST